MDYLWTGDPLLSLFLSLSSTVCLSLSLLPFHRKKGRRGYEKRKSREQSKLSKYKRIIEEDRTKEKRRKKERGKGKE